MIHKKEKGTTSHGDLPPHLSSTLACAAEEVPCLGSGMQVSARSPTPAAEENQCKCHVAIAAPYLGLVNPGGHLNENFRLLHGDRPSGTSQGGESIRKQTQSSPQLLPCYTNSFTSEVEGHTVRVLGKRGVSTEGQSSRGVLTSKHFFQTLSAYTNNKLERGQRGTRDTREDWPTVGHAHVTRDRAQNGGR